MKLLLPYLRSRRRVLIFAALCALIFSVSFLRLVFFPVLTWAILRLLPISNPLVVGVTLIIMAMPSPAISAILAESYHSDKEFASRSVFLSSLLCLISIPLISLLL